VQFSHGLHLSALYQSFIGNNLCCFFLCGLPTLSFYWPSRITFKSIRLCFSYVLDTWM